MSDPATAMQKLIDENARLTERIRDLEHADAERKRAEEALRDANWRMQSVIEGTHAGTWEWNVQTGETIFNEVWAAFLFAQLEVWPVIQHARERIWRAYHDQLVGWCGSNDVRQPVVPEHCEQAWHMYYLLLPSLKARTAVIAHLKTRGILAVSHYLPLHVSDMGRMFGGRQGDCPVTEDVSDRLLRLPFFNAITEAEQARVVAAIHECRL